jgi:hypothetical protein
MRGLEGRVARLEGGDSIPPGACPVCWSWIPRVQFTESQAMPDGTIVPLPDDNPPRRRCLRCGGIGGRPGLIHTLEFVRPVDCSAGGSGSGVPVGTFGET